MILQTSISDYFNLIILLIFLGSCISIPIARRMQARQRAQTAQMLRQMQNNPDQADYEGQPMPFDRRYSRREEKANDAILQRWEEILLTATDPREKMEAIYQLGLYGNKYTLDMLIEYTETDQNPKILAAIEDAMVKIENRLTRPSNEAGDDTVTFYS
jgi:hypothetical protein